MLINPIQYSKYGAVRIRNDSYTTRNKKCIWCSEIKCINRNR